MPRKATGEALRWRNSSQTWAGRVRGYPAGCPRGEWFSLGTNDKPVAQQRYDRWRLTGEPPKEAHAETFEEAALRIVDAMPETTRAEVKKKHDRGTRLRTYAFPFIGQIAAWAIDGGNVSSVLDRMPALGKKKGTIAYVRTDISQVLARLVRNGRRADNPARDMKPPADAVEDGRLRQVPSDEEFLRFRAARGYETDLDLACLMCRDMAAHRTSDLLAARYEHVTDWELGKMKVRRPKTDTEGKLVTTRRIKSYELVEHGVPPHVWVVFLAHWAREGKPLTGPLFPVRKACKGGTVRCKDGTTYERQPSAVGDTKSRNGTGFVKPLRQAFWNAKIYRPMPIGTLIDKVPTTQAFDPANPKKELCFFQTDTDESRALDFHSVRRAAVTALKAAGVPLADLLALCGHSSLLTSNKYDTARLVQMPEGALPHPFVAPAPPDGHPLASASGTFSNVAGPVDTGAILAQLEQLRALLSGGKPSASGAFDPKSGSNGPEGGVTLPAIPMNLLVEPTGIEPVTYALRTQCEPPTASHVLVNTECGVAETDPAEPRLTQNAGQSTSARSALLEAAAKAVAAGDWELADRIRALLGTAPATVDPSPLASVHQLTSARKRK